MNTDAVLVTAALVALAAGCTLVSLVVGDRLRLRCERRQAALLDLVAKAGAEGITGLALCRVSGLRAGSIYPLLNALEEADLVRGRWVDAVAVEYPRHRVYWATPAGEAEARRRVTPTTK